MRAERDKGEWVSESREGGGWEGERKGDFQTQSWLTPLVWATASTAWSAADAATHEQAASADGTGAKFDAYAGWRESGQRGRKGGKGQTERVCEGRKSAIERERNGCVWGGGAGGREERVSRWHWLQSQGISGLKARWGRDRARGREGQGEEKEEEREGKREMEMERERVGEGRGRERDGARHNYTHAGRDARR